MLRPGETFGEVALAMDVPRTATVTTIIPSVLASCDRATFDELLRPLYADDAVGGSVLVAGEPRTAERPEERHPGHGREAGDRDREGRLSRR